MKCRISYFIIFCEGVIVLIEVNTSSNFKKSLKYALVKSLTINNLIRIFF